MRRLSRLVAVGLLVALSGIQPKAQTSTWRPAILSDNGHGRVRSRTRVRARASGSCRQAATPWMRRWRVGRAGPHRAGDDRPRRRHVHPRLPREDRRGEVHQRHGFAPMAATVDFYKSKGGLPTRPALGERARRGGGRGARGENLRHTGRSPRCWRPRPSLPSAASRSPRRSPARSRASGEAHGASSRKIWFNGDRPLEMGERVVQKDLAATLREIGAKGSAAFYEGAIAQKFAAYMKARAASSTQKDLAGYKRQRGHAHSRQLQGRRRLRVPAQLAGLRDAAGPEHPGGDERPLHAPQQRALPARGHRGAEARVCRPQHRSAIRKFVPPISRCARCCRRSTRDRGAP